MWWRLAEIAEQAEMMEADKRRDPGLVKGATTCPSPFWGVGRQALHNIGQVFVKS